MKRVYERMSFYKSNLRVVPEAANRVTRFQFPSLLGQDRLIHGIFTRHGGKSRSPYKSLNTSYATGDEPEIVMKNLKIIRDTINASRLISMNQVHGNDILSLCGDDPYDLKPDSDSDALITDIPHHALMVKQADCQGVIIFDPVRTVVSIVHCGWRGNTCNILGSTVKRMQEDFGCRTSDLMAAIGPSLGPCCAEFITYKEIFPEAFMRYMIRENYFDLWEISRNQLMEAGINRDKIDVAGICTKCRTDLFFSYRAEGLTGRFATVAMLR